MVTEALDVELHFEIIMYKLTWFSIRQIEDLQIIISVSKLRFNFKSSSKFERFFFHNFSKLLSLDFPLRISRERVQKEDSSPQSLVVVHSGLDEFTNVLGGQVRMGGQNNGRRYIFLWRGENSTDMFNT